MKIIQQKLSTEPYNYIRIPVAEFIEQYSTISPFRATQTKKLHKHSKNNKHEYAPYCTELFCGFDIETYTAPSKHGYMYKWQFSLWNGRDIPQVISGHTWEELMQLFTHIGKWAPGRVIVWVANLGFEFQFLRKHVGIITEVFAKEKYHPLKAFLEAYNIELHEALTISGGSLAKLAQDYTRTQKAKGDLDYKIPRVACAEYFTPLTEEEECYCDNDVLILSEFSKYIVEDFIKKQNYIPLTQTQIILKEMKKVAIAEKFGKLKNFQLMIKSLYPSLDLYNFLMRWVFRGGYVHSNVLHTGDIIDESDMAESEDITSSYPAQMLLQYMPLCFLLCSWIKNMDDYYEAIKTKCVIAILKFTGLRPKTSHSIESRHKCLECSNEIIDNGRILYGDITVALTELDFRVYEAAYDWDKVELAGPVYFAERIRLPFYCRKIVEKYYAAKQRLKAEGKPYRVEKSRVNATYGAAVKKMIFTNSTYDGSTHIWSEEDNPKAYEEQVRSAVMVPQWGIYVAAWGRYSVLIPALEIEAEHPGDLLYIDTDSIKFRNGPEHEHVIEEYNRKKLEQVKKLCEEDHLDFELFKDIGSFENEYYLPDGSKHGLLKLKYLGAKRYIRDYYKKQKDGSLKRVTECTVAGLPKEALAHHVERLNSEGGNVDIYDAFDDNMYIELAEKNIPYYWDDEYTENITDNYGVTVTMSEKSSIGIVENHFKLSMDEAYVRLINRYHEEDKNKEKR